jgi:hypothetical protein
MKPRRIVLGDTELPGPALSPILSHLLPVDHTSDINMKDSDSSLDRGITYIVLFFPV